MQERMVALIESVSVAFEFAGVLVILVGFGYALLRAYRSARRESGGSAYLELRATFGRSILLGLEILVAADLIRTIAVEPTLDNLAVLGVLIVLRTFLSFSLEVEIDGRWPWQHSKAELEPLRTEED
ncbi:MAG: DUF1622 domain-containing protein [Actinomycetota bacterium]|nr:DUF1622 domain-containing protein [Actinomycetota bacterium]